MRKVFACLLGLILVLSLGAPVVAQSPVVQHHYSATANSGIRHEVCTTLEGTSAGSYYTGSYTFDILSEQSGDTLLESLRTLMTVTHTHYTTYSDCRDLAVKTDCEKGDGTTISLLYSSYVSDRSEYINNTTKGWNREHVWPVSLGTFNKDQTPGCDLHHIRPTDSLLNETRGNEKYGIVTSGKEMYGTPITGNAHGGKKGGGYMEPLDNVKGDVARICLYMYVRYGREYAGCNDITNVFQSVEVLLQWCALDPVDTWEMGRNEVVYAIQGNRNVFIDYPELAWQLFDRECPAGMTTPSGNAAPCEHPDKELRNEKEPTCGLAGYSGDIYCADCDQRLDIGRRIHATGKHSFGQWELVEDGDIEARSCTVCGSRETRQRENNGSLWIWIAAGAGIVALGATVTVIVVIKKKKR